MKKKIVTLVLSLMLCLGVVPTMTACGKKSDVTVFLLTNAQENAFYTAHFAGVASDMGIKIGYTGQASADYYRLLRNEINKGAAPDIFYVRPSDIRMFINDGLIADISEYVNAEEYAQTLGRVHTSAKNMYKYDKASKAWGTGGTYAIPKDLSVQQLGYNKTLIEKNRKLIYNYYNAPAHAAEKAAMPVNASGTNQGQVKMPWEMDWTTENYTLTQYKTMAALLSAGGKDGLNNNDVAVGDTIYGCDFPNYEVLMWAFGGTLLSDDLQTVNVRSEAFQKAGKYLADLLDSGAASYSGATFNHFTGERNVCFYSGVNSYDIKAFDDNIGAGNWGVMPWPIADPTGDYAKVGGGTAQPTDWQGIITSAGFAVSSSCKDKARAVKIIMTLLADDVQDTLVQTEKLQLPLFADVADAFVTSSYDTIYNLDRACRKVYIDVIKGTNGRTSDLYRSYEDDWNKYISTNLFEFIYQANKGSGLSTYNSKYNADGFKEAVEKKYNDTKNA